MNNTTSVKERLALFLEEIGVNKSEFGRRIGVSSAFITSMRKSLQPDKVAAIRDKFPELNIDWLLTGEGEMLAASASAGEGGVRPVGCHVAHVPPFRFLRFMSANNGEFLVNADNIVSAIPSGERSLLRFRQPIAIPSREGLAVEVEVQDSFESVSLRLAGVGNPSQRMEF